MEKPSLISSLDDIVFLFSTFNDGSNPILAHNLELLEMLGARSLVSDGTKFPWSTRGQRFDELLKECKAELLVFVHPRTYLSQEAVRALLGLPQSCKWGAFTHSFDRRHPLLDFTSFWSNHVRGRLSSIYYLDHVLFVRSSLALRVGFPHDPIFEDTLFCQRLKRFAAPTRLPVKLQTSAVRFEKNGILKQALLNQLMKVGFHLGVSPKLLNDLYEEGLELNQEIKK